jgi:2'-5' RNA ligase
MGLLRTFIAVEIPPHLQHKIQHASEPLRKALGTSIIRWVSEQNVHLTLKFLGDVSPASMDHLTQILRTEADSCPGFDLQIGGLGSFPSLRRPRVLFIGIQAPAELEVLHHGISSSCMRLGYESERRGFSPHLTLGRVKQDASAVDQQKIRRALAETKIDSLGTARVNSVHLYKSELKSSGPVYTQIFSAPLKK